MPAHTDKDTDTDTETDTCTAAAAIEMHIPPDTNSPLQWPGCSQAAVRLSTSYSHILNYELALIQRVIKIAI